MQNTERSTRPIVVFTDGAAKGNPGPGGWGVVIASPAGRVRELGGGSRHTTNNRMELTAPIEALSHLKETQGKIAIYTDSTYVIRGIREWIRNWERRGWRTIEGKDVVNRDLWERLWQLVQDREDGVEWHYVRGHTGIPGNERVDEIANAFALQEDPGLYEGPIREYPVRVFDLPEDTSLPAGSNSNNSSAGGKNRTPYSYLSVVDGVAMRHATWPECEQRVKGRSGVRFKKAMSAQEEAEILKAWGVTLF
jgi:ribonuclease HI